MVLSDVEMHKRQTLLRFINVQSATLQNLLTEGYEARP